MAKLIREQIVDALNTDTEVAAIPPVKTRKLVNAVFDSGVRFRVAEIVEALAGISLGLKAYELETQKAAFMAQVRLLADLIEELQHLRTVAEASTK